MIGFRTEIGFGGASAAGRRRVVGASLPSSEDGSALNAVSRLASVACGQDVGGDLRKPFAPTSVSETMSLACRRLVIGEPRGWIRLESSLALGVTSPTLRGSVRPTSIPTFGTQHFGTCAAGTSPTQRPTYSVWHCQCGRNGVGHRLLSKVAVGQRAASPSCQR